MAWMQTKSGVAFDLKPAEPKNVRLDDIAYALAHVNRYGGHAGVYSVAEHCVHVANYLIPQGPSVALSGLLHDAPEAYLGDMIYPVQLSMGLAFREMWKAANAQLGATIIEALGLEGLGIDLAGYLVKDADNRILIDERDQLMVRCEGDWFQGRDAPAPLGVTIRRWNPSEAESMWRQTFTAMARELTLASMVTA